MADRIKGITVEIGGDTTDLSASLRGINNESKSIGKELSDVQRLLKFNPDNVELLEQRQQLLNRQIENTSQRLEHLRSVEHQVQQQFERGDIGEQQFRAFQREIIATEGRLQHFEQQARGTSRNLRAGFAELGKGMAGAIGAAVAGAGLNEVIQKSLESAHTTTQIKVGIDVADDQLPKIQNMVNTIKAYGVDGEAALEGVRRQFALNKSASVEANNAIIKSAAVIANSYAGIDFTELIQETNEMAGSLNMSQKDALGMVNTLLKMGFPPDQLDIITEYGAQLKRAGYNASEIQGIFAAGIDTKSWNIDKLMDGVKEGRIRLAEFGIQVDKTTAGLIKGTGISASELQKWGAAVAEGGDGAKVAMGEVATKLANIDDASKRNAVGVRLFGTMWEDTGAKVTDTILNYKKNAGDAKTNQDNLNASISQMNADPQVRLNQAMAQMQTELTPLLASIAEFVAKIADWAAKNPELAATIIAVTVGLGILIGLITAGAAVFATLSAAAAAAEIALLPFIAIAAAVVVGLGLLVAAIVYCVRHWNEIKAAVVSFVNVAGQKFDEFKAAASTKIKAATDKVKEIWNTVMSWFRSIDLSSIGRNVMQGFLNGISSMASKIWNKAKEIANNVGKTLSKALHLGSPSKLTFQFGKWTGEGLVLGLEDSIRAINHASNKMAAAALPNYQAPTIQNQTVGSKTMAVNFYSPKALDVREANKEFSRTMNRMALMW